MWSLSRGGPERPMASSSRAWALHLAATNHRHCPGGRRQRALTALTIFLFLPSFPTSGCPDVCSCSLGKVNCVDRGLRLVPLQLPTNATALLLEHNLIATLQNGSFAAQKVLRRLSLRNNVLTSIHHLALVGLHELQDLDLSNNSLSLLHPDTFLPVPTLRTLRLGHNRLLRLGPELPRALPHLRALFVHRNALSDLPTGFFESLPSLSYLTLEGNPWICSCGLWSLFLWLAKNRDKVPEANSLTCKRRASLTQYPISALGNASFAHCQPPQMHLPGYAFLLLIGPSTFLASICVGILLGSVAVAHLKLRRMGSCIRPLAWVQRIIEGSLPVLPRSNPFLFSFLFFLFLPSFPPSFLPSPSNPSPPAGPSVWYLLQSLQVTSTSTSHGILCFQLLQLVRYFQYLFLLNHPRIPELSCLAPLLQLTSKTGLRLGNWEHIDQPVFPSACKKQRKTLQQVFVEILF